MMPHEGLLPKDRDCSQPSATPEQVAAFPGCKLSSDTFTVPVAVTTDQARAAIASLLSGDPEHFRPADLLLVFLAQCKIMEIERPMKELRAMLEVERIHSELMKAAYANPKVCKCLDPSRPSPECEAHRKCNCAERSVKHIGWLCLVHGWQNKGAAQ